ncbi:MAG: polysaccharide pyruvyl transferase family protein [Bacteroidaceae bacterium]|nr:polysaccharide pyruvyl transferase family protein [Bacteroidaceae bacterium]
MERKNILIVQNFNPNKGNSSVISATMHVLKDENVNIEITSAVPEKGQKQYNVNCYEWLVSYKDIIYQKSKFKKTIALLKEMLWVVYLFLWIGCYKIGITLPIPKRKKETVKAYMRADVVVFPGGHSFTTMNGLGQVFSHCIGFHFGNILKKKTMVYAHTIGPFKGRFSGIIKWMSMYVLKRTTLVTIREKDSMKFCKDINAKLTAETVFSLPTDFTLAENNAELRDLRKKGKKVIGLTIHHIYYKYFFTKEEYMKIMTDIINLIIDKYACNVLLIPMESKTGNYNDRNMAYEMREMLNKKECFSVIENDYESNVTAAIIGCTDLFIGTKTHSIVYGLKSEVPTLSIAYQQKANEFMEMYGVLENSINLKSLNVAAFEKIFCRMINNLEEVREKEHKSNNIIIKKSLENRDLLINLLK